MSTTPQQSVAEHPTANPTGRSSATWSLVARREIKVRLTDRNFLITTGITLLMLVLLFGIQVLFSGNGAEYRVGVQDEQGAAIVSTAATTIEAVEESDSLTSTTFADRAAGEAAVQEGEIDAYLVQGDQGWEYLTDGMPNQTLLGAVNQAVSAEVLTERADELGTSVQELTAGTSVIPVDLAGEGGTNALTSFVLPFAFAILFYFAAIMFGMAIANSVIEEKQSRIVEILAAMIPTRQLLLGKVLGNTALAMLQLIAIAAVAVIGMSVIDVGIELSGVLTAVLWYLPFFLAGFLALACVWAAGGALASRTEDLQSTTMPVTMALVAVLFVGISVSGVWEVVASYVPVLSTIVMPSRILDGSALWWEPIISLALTIGFVGLSIAAGGRLYQRSLLQTQGKLSMRQAWSAKA